MDHWTLVKVMVNHGIFGLGHEMYIPHSLNLQVPCQDDLLNDVKEKILLYICTYVHALMLRLLHLLLLYF